MIPKKRNAMLEYRLTDALEMNYSKNRKILKALKQKLLNRSIKDSNLYPLPSFVLEDALVVIQDGDLKQIKELYLLNAHQETFKTFGINQSLEGKDER